MLWSPPAPTCVVFISLCGAREQLSHGGTDGLGGAAQILSTFLQLKQKGQKKKRLLDNKKTLSLSVLCFIANSCVSLFGGTSLTDSPGSGFSCSLAAAALASCSSLLRVWMAVSAESISMGPQASCACVSTVTKVTKLVKHFFEKKKKGFIQSLEVINIHIC